MMKAHGFKEHGVHAGREIAPECVCGWVGEATLYPGDCKAQMRRHARVVVKARMSTRKGGATHGA